MPACGYWEPGRRAGVAGGRRCGLRVRKPVSLAGLACWAGRPVDLRFCEAALAAREEAIPPSGRTQDSPFVAA